MKTKIEKPERNTETIAIRLPASILQALSKLAKQHKVSRGHVIRSLLEAAIGKENA